MLIKYTITIDGKEEELSNSDLRNWDSIKCSYKRSDFSGITRSFTTQFEFVGEAYAKLMALYLKDGYNAKCALSVYAITERWEWEKQFDCIFDFSTITWTATVLKISCLDNSLAALIKANKSTTYEFEVGETADIAPDGEMLFNRLPITEDVTYSYTEGGSDEEDGSLYMPMPNQDTHRLMMGVSQESHIAIGRAIRYNDDQDSSTGSYMLYAIKSAKVTADISIDFDQCYGNGAVRSKLTIYRADGTTKEVSDINIGNLGKEFVGAYESEEELYQAYPHDSLIDSDGQLIERYWATVRGVVYTVKYRGTIALSGWERENVTESEFRRVLVRKSFALLLNAGDKVAVATTGTSASHIYSSQFKFSWINRGASVKIDTLDPVRVAEAILGKISNGELTVRATISAKDARLQSARILASESIRGLNKAKLYTSFNDFTGWMETAFGYVYTIGEAEPSKLVFNADALRPTNYTEDYPLLNGEYDWYEQGYTTPPTADEILYVPQVGKFCAYRQSRYFGRFPNDGKYNLASLGRPREDTLFKVVERISNNQTIEKYIYFEDGEVRYFRGKPENANKPMQKVCFIHRSELLEGEEVKKIAQVRDASYSVNASLVYANVTIGYEKKDYEGICGRDEFNFYNTYTTNSSVSDKSLSILSKYRADSYGIEFAAQKRGNDTTDSASDKDVFFAICTKEGKTWMPDTSMAITGALSEEVFNASVSPMACIRANAGIIGRQAGSLTLKFASSTGNSNISIQGEAMSANIVVYDRLATCGELTFSTDSVCHLTDVNKLIEIESGGVRYQGYISEADMTFAKKVATKYKLIVKNIIE